MPTVKQQDPDLERYIEHDINRPAPVANPVLLSPTSQQPRLYPLFEARHVAKPVEQEVSVSISPDNETSQKTDRYYPDKPAWKTQSRVAEMDLPGSGTTGMSKRRQLWEDAWANRAKAWQRAYGPMSAKKQEASTAQQERDWDRLALLKDKADSGERGEYTLQTESIKLRPPYDDARARVAASTIPHPDRKDTAERSHRWKEFSKVWKEEQSLSEGQLDSPAKEREQMTQRWESIQHLSPDDFDAEMNHYRARNDRLPWNKQVPRPDRNEQANEARHVGRMNRTEEPVDESSNMPEAASNTQSRLDPVTREGWKRLWRERSDACQQIFGRKVNDKIKRQRENLLRGLVDRNSPDVTRDAALAYEKLSAHFMKLPKIQLVSEYWGHEEEAMWVPNHAVWEEKVRSQSRKGHIGAESSTEAQGRQRDTAPEEVYHRNDTGRKESLVLEPGIAEKIPAASRTGPDDFGPADDSKVTDQKAKGTRRNPEQEAKVVSDADITKHDDGAQRKGEFRSCSDRFPGR